MAYMKRIAVFTLKNQRTCHRKIYIFATKSSRKVFVISSYTQQYRGGSCFFLL